MDLTLSQNILNHKKLNLNENTFSFIYRLLTSAIDFFNI